MTEAEDTLELDSIQVAAAFADGPDLAAAHATLRAARAPQEEEEPSALKAKCDQLAPKYLQEAEMHEDAARSAAARGRVFLGATLLLATLSALPNGALLSLVVPEPAARVARVAAPAAVALALCGVAVAHWVQRPQACAVRHQRRAREYRHLRELVVLAGGYVQDGAKGRPTGDYGHVVAVFTERQQMLEQDPLKVPPAVSERRARAAGRLAAQNARQSS